MANSISILNYKTERKLDIVDEDIDLLLEIFQKISNYGSFGKITDNRKIERIRNLYMKISLCCGAEKDLLKEMMKWRLGQ